MTRFFLPLKTDFSLQKLPELDIVKLLPYALRTIKEAQPNWEGYILA